MAYSFVWVKKVGKTQPDPADWKAECKKQMAKVIQKCVTDTAGGKTGGHTHEQDGKVVFGFDVLWEKVPAKP